MRRRNKRLPNDPRSNCIEYYNRATRVHSKLFMYAMRSPNSPNRILVEPDCRNVMIPAVYATQEHCRIDAKISSATRLCPLKIGKPVAPLALNKSTFFSYKAPRVNGAENRQKSLFRRSRFDCSYSYM